MRPEHGTGQSAVEETTELVRELDTLKQQGSNLLVIGSCISPTHRAACRQLLGEESTEPRHRLLVRADPRQSELKHGIDDSGSRNWDSVVRYETTSRSVTAAGTTADSTFAEPPIDGDLDSLETAISSEIDEIEARNGGLSPAELRLCFDSLTPLLSEYDPETTVRFLRTLTHRIRSANGMGHYHLTTDRTSETVALLEPLFDGVIELAVRDGALFQRWDLVDSGLTSGWLQLQRWR